MLHLFGIWFVWLFSTQSRLKRFPHFPLISYQKLDTQVVRDRATGSRHPLTCSFQTKKPKDELWGEHKSFLQVNLGFWVYTFDDHILDQRLWCKACFRWMSSDFLARNTESQNLFSPSPHHIHQHARKGPQNLQGAEKSIYIYIFYISFQDSLDTQCFQWEVPSLSCLPAGCSFGHSRN